MFQQTHKHRPVPPSPDGSDFTPMVIMLSIIVLNCFGSAVVLNIYKYFPLAFAAFVAGASVAVSIHLFDLKERRKTYRSLRPNSL